MRFPAVHSFVVRVGLVGALSVPATAARSDVAGYPAGVDEIRFRSAGDDSLQPALFWAPKSDQAVPLLVALHTWSSSYHGKEPTYAEWSQRCGWAFLYPNFRGPNKTAAALGSDLVVEDILSAVRHAQSVANIDVNRIYCVGVSGGGHAALLMAARAPQLWAGVSAWCGIADIAAWYRQCHGTQFARYAEHIERALGGPPQSAPARMASAKHRSPVTWLAQATQLPPLDINHGIADGRAGSVPFTHSLHAWNAAVPATSELDTDSIDHFYASQQVPASLQATNVARPDPLYGQNQPIYRCHHGPVRLTVFQGGHEIVHHAALNWLAAQAKGSAVDWQPVARLDLRAASAEQTAAEQQSGK